MKPGDYGSVLFKIVVSSNPAWLVNCLGAGETVTDIEYPNGVDPEDTPHDIYGDILGASIDTSGGDRVHGNLGDLLMVIPLYDEDDTSTFFDQDGPDSLSPESRYGIGCPGTFWSNEQEGLNPLAYNQALANSSVGTALWPDEDAAELLTDGSLECSKGCYLLHGQLSDLSGGERSDNTPDENAAPLQPGSTMYFGYDWHLPWEVGNYAQDATFEFNIGFSFVQERHSGGSRFPNMYEYDPESAA